MGQSFALRQKKKPRKTGLRCGIVLRLLELISNAATIKINSRFTHFAIVVKFEEKYDWQANRFAAFSVMTLRDTFPYRAVSVGQSTSFYVCPVCPEVAEPGEKLSDFLSVGLRFLRWRGEDMDLAGVRCEQVGRV